MKELRDLKDYTIGEGPEGTGIRDALARGSPQTANAFAPAPLWNRANIGMGLNATGIQVVLTRDPVQTGLMSAPFPHSSKKRSRPSSSHEEISLCGFSRLGKAPYDACSRVIVQGIGFRVQGISSYTSILGGV